jgi:hypothetical protein
MKHAKINNPKFKRMIIRRGHKDPMQKYKEELEEMIESQKVDKAETKVNPFVELGILNKHFEMIAKRNQTV